MQKDKTETFAKEYAKLKNIEATINNLKEQDVDSLNELVGAAIQSAKFCEDRIQKIKENLEETFKE